MWIRADKGCLAAYKDRYRPREVASFHKGWIRADKESLTADKGRYRPREVASFHIVWITVDSVDKRSLAAYKKILKF